jgi:alpha-glucosidase
MLAYTRQVLAVRKATPALQTGVALPLTSPDMVLAFQRVLESEHIGCYFELGGEAARIDDIGRGEALLLTGGARIVGGKLELPPYAAGIIRL